MVGNGTISKYLGNKWTQVLKMYIYIPWKSKTINKKTINKAIATPILDD